MQEDSDYQGEVGQRIAQTFAEPNGGRLNWAELVLANLAGATGDYQMQVNTVNPDTGVPTNDTIASTIVPRSEVGNNPDFVRFTFGTPATLVAGRQYALVLSRPSGSGRHFVPVQVPGTCPGGATFFSGSATGAFSGGTGDISYQTFVSP